MFESVRLTEIIANIILFVNILLGYQTNFFFFFASLLSKLLTQSTTCNNRIELKSLPDKQLPFRYTVVKV